MKKVNLIIIILVCFSFIGYSQEKTQSNAKQPKATYQVGSAKITVWENSGKYGKWNNFKVENIYMKDDQWKSTNSFNEKELFELKAVIDKVIAKENLRVKTEEMKIEE